MTVLQSMGIPQRDPKTIEFLALDLSFTDFLGIQNDLRKATEIGNCDHLQLPNWTVRDATVLHSLSCHTQKEFLIHSLEAIDHEQSLGYIQRINIEDFTANYPTFQSLWNSDVGLIGIKLGKPWGELLVLVERLGIRSFNQLQAVHAGLRNHNFQGICNATQDDFALVAEYSQAHPHKTGNNTTKAEILQWEFNRQFPNQIGGVEFF